MTALLFSLLILFLNLSILIHCQEVNIEGEFYEKMNIIVFHGQLDLHNLNSFYVKPKTGEPFYNKSINCVI